MLEKEENINQKILRNFPELALESLSPKEPDLAWHLRKKGLEPEDADWLAAWLVKYFMGEIFLEGHPTAPKLWRKIGKR